MFFPARLALLPPAGAPRQRRARAAGRAVHTSGTRPGRLSILFLAHCSRRADVPPLATSQSQARATPEQPETRSRGRVLVGAKRRPCEPSMSRPALLFGARDTASHGATCTPLALSHRRRSPVAHPSPRLAGWLAGGPAAATDAQQGGARGAPQEAGLKQAAGGAIKPLGIEPRRPQSVGGAPRLISRGLSMSSKSPGRPAGPKGAPCSVVARGAAWASRRVALSLAAHSAQRALHCTLSMAAHRAQCTEHSAQGRVHEAECTMQRAVHQWAECASAEKLELVATVVPFGARSGGSISSALSSFPLAGPPS